MRLGQTYSISCVAVAVTANSAAWVVDRGRSIMDDTSDLVAVLAVVATVSCLLAMAGTGNKIVLVIAAFLSSSGFRDRFVEPTEGIEFDPALGLQPIVAAFLAAAAVLYGRRGTIVRQDSGDR